MVISLQENMDTTGYRTGFPLAGSGNISIPHSGLLNQVVHIRDTITTRLGSISVIATASHQWDFYRLLSKKDALRLQTGFLCLIPVPQRWNISHSSSFFPATPLVQNYLKRRFGDGSDSDSYKLPVYRFLAQASYYYGKFYLQTAVIS